MDHVLSFKISSAAFSYFRFPFWWWNGIRVYLLKEYQKKRGKSMCIPFEISPVSFYRLCKSEKQKNSCRYFRQLHFLSLWNYLTFLYSRRPTRRNCGLKISHPFEFRGIGSFLTAPSQMISIWPSGSDTSDPLYFPSLRVLWCYRKGRTSFSGITGFCLHHTERLRRSVLL